MPLRSIYSDFGFSLHQQSAAFVYLPYKYLVVCDLAAIESLWPEACMRGLKISTIHRLTMSGLVWSVERSLSPWSTQYTLVRRFTDIRPLMWVSVQPSNPSGVY